MLLFTVGLVILGTLVLLCVGWEVRTSGVWDWFGGLTTPVRT